MVVQNVSLRKSGALNRLAVQFYSHLYMSSFNYATGHKISDYRENETKDLISLEQLSVLTRFVSNSRLYFPAANNRQD